MATGMQINSIAIPCPMDERGVYAFDRAVISKNGRGAATYAPYSTLNWQWDYLALDTSNLAWWITTLLSGAASAEFTQCKLFNKVGALTTFSHCTVYAPTYERLQDGLAWNVQLTIDWIY